MQRTAEGHSASLEPDGLPSETEFAMTEIPPPGTFCQGAKFADGKGALGGEAGIGASHRLAKNQGR
jgi:hypothetical protein